MLCALDRERRLKDYYTNVFYSTMSETTSPILNNLRRNFSAASARSEGSLGGSFRMIALQATSTEADTVRSISGRLGGKFDSSRTTGLGASGASQGSLPNFTGVELPTEGTHLVMPPSPGLTVGSADGGVDSMKPHSPPLATWIFPALSCAAAYAFYNVSLSYHDLIT